MSPRGMAYASHSARERMVLVRVTLDICEGFIPENFHIYKKYVKQQMH
jgi:hypothetical protein